MPIVQIAVDSAKVVIDNFLGSQVVGVPLNSLADVGIVVAFAIGVFGIGKYLWDTYVPKAKEK
jgi:hypothetical protein